MCWIAQRRLVLNCTARLLERARVRGEESNLGENVSMKQVCAVLAAAAVLGYAAASPATADDVAVIVNPDRSIT